MRAREFFRLVRVQVHPITCQSHARHVNVSHYMAKAKKYSNEKKKRI